MPGMCCAVMNFRGYDTAWFKRNATKLDRAFKRTGLHLVMTFDAFLCDQYLHYRERRAASLRQRRLLNS